MRVAALQMVSGTHLQANLDDARRLLERASAFTWTTGQAHWEVLLRARAIENLADVQRERLNALRMQLPTFKHGVL